MKSRYYINLNGKYGLGAYERPDFATLSDLLKHMDRLGIWQTVVWHSNARDLHPVFGNRFLLEDMKNTPGAIERVIPAMAVNPSMLVAQGEMEWLEECMSDAIAPCLIIFPKTNRYRIMEYDRLLERLRKYKPIVLMDVAELVGSGNPEEHAEDMEDLIRLAHEFPEMSFVIKQVMWWQYSKMFRVLSKTNNIYMDTSWLHTRDAIRLVCEHIGSGRLLFGVGFKSHGGAALAGLSYADICQEEKDAIASDNFIALIKDPAQKARILQNRREVQHQIHNSYWDDFMAEKGVRDTLVIDAHSHIGPFNRSWYLAEHEIEGQIGQLERDMKRLGIKKIISQPETALFGQPIEGNRMVEREIKELNTSFRGNLFFNPHYSSEYTEELLDDFFRGGYFCGFKLLPEYLGVDIADERYRLALEYANKHRQHILFHTWEGKYGTALQVAKVAVSYPEATFLLGHTGGGTVGRRQCEEIAQDSCYDNCVFEFSGSFTTEICWEETLKKIDYRRVVFGTDTIVHDMAWEMGRLLSLDIPKEWLRAILGENMQRILDRAQLPCQKGEK